MVKNKFIQAISRGSSLIVAVFALCFLLSSSAFAIYYTNDYPVYLPFVGAKYVEVNTSLGRGSLVLSASIPDNYISVGMSNSNLYNNTSSTLYGTFRTQNGADYSIRFQSFSTPEYYTAGYNPTYTALGITEILNTNIKFVDFNDTDKQNDTFIITDNVTIFYFSLLIVLTLSNILLCFLSLRRSD